VLILMEDDMLANMLQKPVLSTAGRP